MSHRAKPIDANVPIVAASVNSEWDANGATVPATMPDSVNCRKPCSDDAMPRIAGNRSSRIRLHDGKVRLLPAVQRDGVEVKMVAHEASL